MAVVGMGSDTGSRGRQKKGEAMQDSERGLGG